jgi:transcriptional coactivator HFI1/ADA1
LFSEINEFPTAEIIQSRMIPICYEEGVVNGATTNCSEFMNVATEMYIKEALTTFFGRVSTNGPNFVKTAKYKRQLEKEEDALLNGEISRNPAGLLPVEAEECAKRQPLTMGDLRLALELGDSYLGQVPIISAEIRHSGTSDAFDERNENERTKEAELTNSTGPRLNGVNGINGHADDAMDIDEPEMIWQGVNPKSMTAIHSALDECLAIGG